MQLAVPAAVPAAVLLPVVGLLPAGLLLPAACLLPAVGLLPAAAHPYLHVQYSMHVLQGRLTFVSLQTSADGKH